MSYTPDFNKFGGINLSDSPDNKAGLSLEMARGMIDTKAASDELTLFELCEKMLDPNFLPTRDQIMKAFKTPQLWEKFCFDKKNPVFEFLNEEYLNGLADYFVSRLDEYGASEENPLIILEVGAGSGRLSHFLRQKIEERTPEKIKIIATDSGEWCLKSDFPVEQLDCKAALVKYNPDIAIFSWMPLKKDSSKDFRECDSVKEYVLIGESGGGGCGDDWETWGYRPCYGDEERERVEAAPYMADGFEREALDDLSRLQICRSDYTPNENGHSSTVSFRRIS